MLFEYDHVFLILKIMLSTLMTLLMMASITTFKYTKKRVILCFGIYLAYVLASSILLVLKLPWMVFLRVFIFTITLPGTILVYMLAKDSATQAIFNYATQVDLFIFLAVTATMINTALRGNQITDLLLRSVLFSSAALLEFKFLRRAFCRLTDSLRSNWLPMAMIPVAFCVLLIVCGLFPSHYTEREWAVVQVYTIFAVMGIVYFVLAGSLLKSYRLLEQQLEIDVMNAQLYAPQRHMEVLLKSKKLLLEIRRGVARADAMLQDGDGGGAHEALCALQPELDGIDREQLCANPYINEVLTYYMGQFQENNIPFTIDVELGGAQPPEGEVCLILNNALQNALEASLAMPETERSVRLQAMPKQGQFLMRVRNRFNGKLIIRNGLPRSTKRDHGHGYGLSSIRAAAVGAGGDMVYHIKDGDFILDARVRATSKR